jgi:ribosomal protein L9
MATKELKAKRNLTLDDTSGVPIPKGAKHATVEKGEVFDCEEEYADKHLIPHGHAVDADEADEEEADADEKEAEELAKQAAEKKEKAAAKKAKVAEKKAKKGKKSKSDDEPKE